MNLLGKIFVVLIFVMSMLFMAFSVCVFATHRNWNEQVKALEGEVNTSRTQNTTLTEQLEQMKSVLQHERAARASAVTSLQGRLNVANDQVSTMRTQVAQMEAQRVEQLATVNSSQSLLKTLKDDNTALQQQISDARAVADQKLQQAQKATDAYNQLQAELIRLRRRNTEAMELVARAKVQLGRFGKKLEDPLIDIPPQLDGEVEQVLKEKFVKVSIGLDDGLQKNHELDFYRRDQYLGRGRVFQVTPEAAFVELTSVEGRGIRSGDSVATRVE